MTVAENRLRTYAEEAITVDDTARYLNQNTDANLYASPPPDRIDIQVRGAQLRYRVDGTAPTASVGRLRNPFDEITLMNRDDMVAFRAIRAGTTNATIWVRYFRYH